MRVEGPEGVELTQACQQDAALNTAKQWPLVIKVASGSVSLIKNFACYIFNSVF